MKKLLSAATVALLSTVGVAHAQTTHSSWSGETPGIFPGSTVVYSDTFAGHGLFNTAVFLGAPNYEQSTTASHNSDTANAVVPNKWKITGSVTPDCSYYGSSATTRTLALGTIGVNTQSATSVSEAFRSNAVNTANVSSSLAGCNFRNTVTVSKANGASGLVNSAPGAYNAAEFQANLPYSAKVSFRSAASGPLSSVEATTGLASKVGNFGAWRSAMDLDITIPQSTLGLVAGSYEDTVTVTLDAS